MTIGAGGAWGSPRVQIGALISAWTPPSPGEGLDRLRGEYSEHSPLCVGGVGVGVGMSLLVLLPERLSLLSEFGGS